MAQSPKLAVGSTVERKESKMPYGPSKNWCQKDTGSTVHLSGAVEQALEDVGAISFSTPTCTYIKRAIKPFVYRHNNGPWIPLDTPGWTGIELTFTDTATESVIVMTDLGTTYEYRRNTDCIR